MNEDEARVFKYLRAKFGQGVVFEPDGKVPPDFAVDSMFAVEARRLNQHYFDEDKAEGLEQLLFPIFEVVRDILSSFDSVYQGRTYWILIDFERPLTTSMRQAKKNMEAALSEFLTSGVTEFPCVLPVGNKIEFTVYSSRPINGRVFQLGGGSDQNAGGWLLPVYSENISHCIREKSSKVSGYLTKYQKWWLYLVDHMGWGLDSDETQNLISSINDIGNFDAIFILSSDGSSLLASISA